MQNAAYVTHRASPSVQSCHEMNYSIKLPIFILLALLLHF